MQVFISHGSHLKPIVHKCLESFPSHIKRYFDEEDLHLGDKLHESFESAIKTKSDYFLLFVDKETVKSDWVKKEIRWAFEKEREIGRKFLLPVVVGKIDIKKSIPEISDRKYVKLSEYADHDVHNMSTQLLSELFALISIYLDEKQKTVQEKGPRQMLDESEAFLSTVAASIQKIVFPCRKENPITSDAVYSNIKNCGIDIGASQEFDRIVRTLTTRGFIPGICYERNKFYVVEEHHSWKSTLNHEHKIAIAQRAAGFVKNNMNVYIDAGSTTKEIVEILCDRIKSDVLNSVTLTVVSIDHAKMLVDCCASKNHNELSSLVKLYVPGGQIRPLTNAIIPFGNDDIALHNITKEIGEFDVAIMGINGVDLTAGLTTACKDEALRKINVLKVSKTKIFVCDASKCGIPLENTVTGFEKDVKIVINEDKSNLEWEKIVQSHPENVIIVKHYTPDVL